MTATESLNLRAIEDREESAAAFRLLTRSLQQGAEVFADHLVGWSGGSGRFATYWLPDVGIWAVLEQVAPRTKPGRPTARFWNCFGLQNPAQRPMLSITVEINPPHEGADRRLGGLFARDQDNRVYIAHTGKVGGGRPGIGRKAFRTFLADAPWREIDSTRGVSIALVFGPIDAPEFRSQIAGFVHDVVRFKESIAPRPRPRADR